MTETTETVKKSDTEQARTEISYCPRLGLYHYKSADGAEFFFNRQKLEDSIAAYLKVGDNRQAEFMAVVTSFARQYPHVLVAIKADGSYELTRLEIPDDEKATKVVDDLPETSNSK